MTSFVGIVAAADVRAAEARDNAGRMSFRVPLSPTGAAPPTHYGGHLTTDDAGLAGFIAGFAEMVASSYDPATGETGADHFALVLSQQGLQRVLSNAVPLTLKASASGLTGSIAAGSNTLTLAAVDGAIQVGDRLIVEVGGEAGAGMRGTRGVGGVWPALSYGDGAARGADTGQSNGTYAWDEDTGDVYQWNGSAWASQSYFYYLAKAVPRALIATVTAVAGTSVTLDVAAAQSAVGAAVHIDMAPVINAVTGADGYGSRCDVRLPAGVFALSGRVLLQSRPQWTLRGQGKGVTTLFTPRGASGAAIEVASSPRAVIRDLTLTGNTVEHGYGLSWDTGRMREDGRSVGFMGRGVDVTVSSEAEICDCAVIDTAQGIAASGCAETWARRCDVTLTEGLFTYIQWHCQWADTFGGGVEDTSLTSPTLVAGIEAFKAVGTTFRRMTLINASAAVNTGGGFLFEDIDVTIEAGSQHPGEAFSQYNPVFNLNTNAGLGPYLDVPGRLHRISIHHEGYINAFNDQLRGVNVNFNYTGIEVTDLTYSAPDWVSGSRTNGPQGVASDAADGMFTDITVEGVANPANWQFANVRVVPSSTLSNVIVDDRVAIQATILTGGNPYNYVPS